MSAIELPSVLAFGTRIDLEPNVHHLDDFAVALGCSVLEGVDLETIQREDVRDFMYPDADATIARRFIKHQEAFDTVMAFIIPPLKPANHRAIEGTARTFLAVAGVKSADRFRGLQVTVSARLPRANERIYAVRDISPSSSIHIGYLHTMETFVENRIRTHNRRQRVAL